jgi:integrase
MTLFVIPISSAGIIMASIATDSSGRRRILFASKDGSRKTIYLGAMPEKMARGVLVRVEQLVSSSVTGHPVDDATSRWLAELDAKLFDKLAAVELVPKREMAKLAVFVDGYIASRTDAKPNTLRNFKTARKCLVDFFGAERPLRSIRSGECDEWRQGLVQDGYAEATISKWVKQARQFFKLAHRKGLIDANPFIDIKAGSQRNEARLEFIDRATIKKVLDAAPNAEWRVIIALARYGGLRTPSETLALKWSDIDWAGDRMTVPSPKTEHQHKPYRVVPLFPELRPYLEAAFDAAPARTVYVVRGYRDDTQNLRTQFFRILRRARVQPWERLFHNLRASRQTELADQFPLHVVTDWIGNSPDIADRHYLKTTEDHFRKAVASDPCTIPVHYAQNTTQQAAETGRNRSQTQNAPSSEDEALLALAGSCEHCTNEQIPPRGVEPRFSG